MEVMTASGIIFMCMIIMFNIQMIIKRNTYELKQLLKSLCFKTISAGRTSFNPENQKYCFFKTKTFYSNCMLKYNIVLHMRLEVRMINNSKSVLIYCLF
jgi:hypothetical protein